LLNPFTLTDKELLLGLSERDENALRVLFDTYYPVLCRFAERFLPDTSLAKDIVQDTFIKLWRAERVFEGLDVIGVSDDDRDSTAWHKAVDKDGLPWHHVLRGLHYDEVKGYDKSNDISEGFAIHTLPTKILIDPAGKIIGRYGSDGEEDAALDAKLQALLP
jgi:hypothetical protein